MNEQSIYVSIGLNLMAWVDIKDPDVQAAMRRAARSISSQILAEQQSAAPTASIVGDSITRELTRR